MVNLDPSGVTLEIIVHDKAVLIEVTETEQHLGIPVGYGIDRQIVVLSDSSPVHYLLPVAVAVLTCIFGRVADTIAVCIDAVIQIAIVFSREAIVDIFLSVKHIDMLRHFGYSYGGIEIDNGLVSRSFRTAFRGDDDDSVSASRTVNGSRRGILEHLDGLNVVRIEE